MGNLNKAMLIGRLGQDPEVKKTQTGISVVNTSLATTNYFKNKVGNTETTTEWHRVVFWGTLADNICNYTKKGSLIFVEGRLQTREWTKDDVRRFTTEVVAERMQFLDSKKEEGAPDDYGQKTNYNDPAVTNPPASKQSPTNFEPPKQNEDFDEDDIPF